MDNEDGRKHKGGNIEKGDSCMKYRYVMGGSFKPEKYEYIHKGTNHRLLCIDIPAPFARDTPEEAMQDGQFAYRFMLINEEVKIAVFPGEDFYVDKNNELKTWLKGEPFYYYNYDEFKALGGMIYELPYGEIFYLPEDLSEEDLIPKIEEWIEEGKSDSTSWDTSDYETTVTFTEMFPNLAQGDKVYIDNESYCIAEEK